MNPKNILIITYWSYKDALIQTYTLPYVRIMQKHLPTGSQVHLVTLEQPSFKVSDAEKEQIKKNLAAQHIHWIPFEYHRFGLKAIWGQFQNILSLLLVCKKQNIDIIQPFCTPAGALGYIVSILTGIPLLIDSFEPHAEPMLESNTWKKDGLAFRILFTLEKKQSQHAKAAIACVHKMKEYALEKYGKVPPHFYQKPACVDLSLFDISKKKNPALLRQLGLENKIVCVYAGKLGGSYLIQEVFDFFAACVEYWGDRFCALMLNNHTEEEMRRWASLSGLEYEKVIRKVFVPHSEVANYVGLADFGITPFIPVPSKRYGTPIKTGEYWAMGLPVVITKDISDDSDTIARYQIGSVLQSLDKESYLRSIKEVDILLTQYSPQEITTKIRGIAQKYRSFDIAEKVYSNIYNHF